MLNLKLCFIFPNIGSVSLYPKMSMISLMISSIHVFCTTVEHLQSWLSCVSRNVCVTTYVHVGEMSWEYPDWNVVVGGPQPSCPVMSDRHKVMAIRTVDKQKCQYLSLYTRDTRTSQTWFCFSKIKSLNAWHLWVCIVFEMFKTLKQEMNVFDMSMRWIYLIPELYVPHRVVVSFVANKVCPSQQTPQSHCIKGWIYSFPQN